MVFNCGKRLQSIETTLLERASLKVINIINTKVIFIMKNKSFF